MFSFYIYYMPQRSSTNPDTRPENFFVLYGIDM